MVNWPDSYSELDDNGIVTSKKYDETDSFKIIWKVAAEYFANARQKEVVLKVGGRSASIRAISQLLTKNSALKLNDVLVSQEVVMRCAWPSTKT